MTRVDRPWDAVPLAILQRRFLDRGLPLTVIEDPPPMDAIRTGTPGRDDELATLTTLVGEHGRARNPRPCINFMAGSGWARTSTE